MAKDNTIMFSVGFDQAKLDKELAKFGRAFNKSLKQALSGLDVSKAIGLDKKFMVKLRFNKAAIKRDFDAALSEVFTSKGRLVKLDFTEAKKQITAFQSVIQPLVIPVKAAPAATTPTASTGTSTPTTATNFDPSTITVNQSAIDTTKTSIANLRTELRALKLDETEVTKATQSLETELKDVQRVLTAIAKEREATRISTGASVLPPLTDKQILGYNKAGVALDNLNDKIKNYDKNQALSNVQTKRAEQFMDSFGFKVGIIGFGMGILGGHLQRLSQAMFQFGTASAKATEPLERVQNLIEQLVEEGTIDPNKKGFVLGEINRLADLPGSNLDAIAKSFRQLSTLGLDIINTLTLLEGITKATGRAGTGAEGVTRVVAQLREFATNPEGKFGERDVRALTEGGGADVAKIVKALGGAGGIQAKGPQAFLLALSEGLKKVPAPLDATIDKLNRMQNAFTRIRVEIQKLISPGLDTLLGVLSKLEAVVVRIAKTFNNLSSANKNFIGNFLVIVPIVAGALAGLLTVLSAIGITLASGKQIIDAYRVAMTALGKSLGGTTKAFSLSNFAVTKSNALIAQGTAVVTGYIDKIKALLFYVGRLGTQFTLKGKTAGATAVDVAPKGLFALSSGAFLGGATTTTALVSRVSLLDKFFVLLKGVPKAAGALTLLGDAFAGFVGGMAKLLGLTNPIGIAINLIIAFITDFGRLRTTIVSGASEMIEAITNLFSVLAKAQKEGTGVGKLINLLIGAVQSLISIFEAASGIIGSTLSAGLSAVGNIINLIADIVDALSQPWDQLFDKLFEAFTVFLARVGLTAEKFFYDLYISLAQAGIRIFESTPLTQFTNQLKVGVAGLIEYREGLDKLDVINGENLKKTLGATKSLKELNAEQRQTVTGGKELETATANLVKQFSLFTEAARDVKQAIDEIGNAWLDAADKLRQGQIDFNAQFTQGVRDREFLRQLNRDVDSASKSLEPFLSGQVTIATNAVKQRGNIDIKKASRDAEIGIDSLNQLLLSRKADNGAGVPDVLQRVFPNITKALKDLQDAFIQVNQSARSGAVDFSVFAQQVEDVRLKSNAAVTALNQVSVTADSPDAVKTAVGKVSDVVTNVTNQVKELSNAATGAAEAESNVANEVIKSREEYLELIRVRKQAIAVENASQLARQRQSQLNEQLIDQEDLLKQAQDEGDLLKIEKINSRIASIRLEIAGYDTTIQQLHNVEQDQLENLRIKNEAVLKIQEIRNERLRNEAQIVRDLGNAYNKTFSDAASKAQSLVEKLRDAGGLSADLGGLAPSSVFDAINKRQDTARQDQRLLRDRQSRELFRETFRNFDPTLANQEIDGVKLQNVARKLLISIGDLSKSTFEGIAADLAGFITSQLNTLLGEQSRLDILLRGLRGKLADPTLSESDKEVAKRQLETIEKQYLAIGVRIKDIGRLDDLVNNNVEERNKLLQDEFELRTRIARQTVRQLQDQRQILELQADLVAEQNRNAELKRQQPGNIQGQIDLKGQDAEANKALETQVKLIQNSIDLQVEELKIKRVALELQLRTTTAKEDEIQATLKLIDKQIQLIKDSGKLKIDNAGLDNATKSFERFKDTLLNISSIGLEGSINKIVQAFKDLKDRVKPEIDNLRTLGEYAKATIEALVTAIPNIITGALKGFFAGTDTFVNALLKGFGEILSTIGGIIVQMALADAALASVVAFQDAIAHGAPWFVALGEAAAAFVIATAQFAPLLLFGAGLMATGALLTHLGTPAQVSGTNTANSTNTATGATGNGFDPNKDPKTIFQKALMAQITIDVKTDDAAIVKTVIKHVNQNGRLTTLIGNRKLRFGY